MLLHTFTELYVASVFSTRSYVYVKELMKMKTEARSIFLLVSVVIVFSDQLTYVLARYRSDCSKYSDNYYDYGPAPYFDSEYSYLYLKLEEALINDEELLDKLRAGFISGENKLLVDFYNIQLEVVNGTNDSCIYRNGHRTFCNSSSTEYMWELCPNYYLDMAFSSHSISEASNNQIDTCLWWLFLIHGCITPTFIYVDFFPNDGHVPYDMDLTLRIKELKCNPPIELMECVLSELLSWVCFPVFGLN